MHSFDDALWTSLDNMRIAPAGAALSFEARLAREQGWGAAYTDRVMREYRRFLYLAATAERPVTPSEEVDAAWHLHLTYSRHYWEKLCGQILGRALHHDPTEGGRAQRAHFFDQYAATLALYEAVFGERPPPDIWPAPARRFGQAAPKQWPRWAAAGGGAIALTACSALATDADGGLNQGAVVGIVLGVALLAALFLLIIGSRQAAVHRKRDQGDGGGTYAGGCGSSGKDGKGDSSDSSSDGGGGCGDGGGGCGGGCS